MDESIFTREWERGSLALRRLARSYARDVDELDELGQRTWVLAFDKRETFRGDGDFVGWLCSIGRTVCARQERLKRRERPVPLADTLRDESLPDDVSARRALRSALYWRSRFSCVASSRLRLPKSRDAARASCPHQNGKQCGSPPGSPRAMPQHPRWSSLSTWSVHIAAHTRRPSRPCLQSSQSVSRLASHIFRCQYTASHDWGRPRWNVLVTRGSCPRC